ncbi:MAG: hypothetical protein FD125_1524 [bacterium]|nr:MAG: hypothetical protein FD125_1524 [bacterium]
MAHYVIAPARRRSGIQTTSPPDLGHRLRLFGLFNILAAAVVVGAFTARPVVPPEADNLTVVELFTSQGCSSCPPANANLVRLARRPDVLALSFSVTYWDQLGWPDTFARPAFTARQRDYQRGLANDNVWTPQMVIDGRADVVGGRMSEIERQIAAHRPFSGPVIRFNPRGVGLAGGSHAERTADAPCPTPMWCVNWCGWARGVDRPWVSHCRPRARRGLRPLSSSRRRMADRSSGRDARPSRTASQTVQVPRDAAAPPHASGPRRLFPAP